MLRRSTFVLLTIVVLLTPSATAPQSGAAGTPVYSRTPSGPPSFGLNSHIATRYPDPATMDKPADVIVELGVNWVREDLHWHRVQPTSNAWDWTFTDAAIHELAERGINILGVLGPSVGWATPFSGDAPDGVSYYAPDPDRFVAYVQAVVTRYRDRIHHWEIWNEPDNAIFWRPHPDPLAYADLLKRATAAIKGIDPHAQTLIGGLNPFDLSFARTVAESGHWDSFDIIAIHPYVDPYSPEAGNLIAAADGIRTMALHYGVKPIWATEIGWSSGPGDRDAIGMTDEEMQANYLVRAMLLLWQAGVEHIFWYTLKDDPHNPYGLIRYGDGRADLEPRKPAFAALRTLNRETAGARFIERRDVFHQHTLLNFEEPREWLRPSQPNGALRRSRLQRYSGAYSAQIAYHFSTTANDYLVFESAQPLRINEELQALGAWVYGDGSGHLIKVWLRDAEGEVLQFNLGVVGEPGWRLLAAPINLRVESNDRIEGDINGRLDFPAYLAAIVLDDSHHTYTGSGTLYVDDLHSITGYVVYDFHLEREGGTLDILWSPFHTPQPFALSYSASVERDGKRNVCAVEETCSAILDSAPLYLWSQRQ